MRGRSGGLWIFVIALIGVACDRSVELPTLVVPEDAVVGDARIDVAIEVPIEDVDRQPGGTLVLPALLVDPRSAR